MCWKAKIYHLSPIHMPWPKHLLLPGIPFQELRLSDQTLYTEWLRGRLPWNLKLFLKTHNIFLKKGGSVVLDGEITFYHPLLITQMMQSKGLFCVGFHIFLPINCIWYYSVTPCLLASSCMNGKNYKFSSFVPPCRKNHNFLSLLLILYWSSHCKNNISVPENLYTWVRKLSLPFPIAVHLSLNVPFLSFFPMLHSCSSGCISINSKHLRGLQENDFGTYLGRIMLVAITFWKLKVSLVLWLHKFLLGKERLFYHYGSRI